MEITVEDFFANAEPKLYSSRGLDIYYSYVNKYHWYCVVKNLFTNKEKIYKIDFEFGDWDDFIDKILLKIERENG